MRHHPERVVELFLFLRDYSKHQDLLRAVPHLPPTPTHKRLHGSICLFVEVPSFPHFLESGLAFKAIFLGKTGHGGIQTDCIIWNHFFN